jgi:UDP-N-acetylglucosamine 1-carboxyvinyltransferase
VVWVPETWLSIQPRCRATVADRPSALRGIHYIERGYHRPFEQFASRA